MIPVLKECIVPGLMLVFGVAYYFKTTGLPDETLLFPHFLMWIMPIFVGLMLLTSFRQKNKNEKEAKELSSLKHFFIEIKGPALLIFMSAGYIVLFSLTGYLPATVAFTFLTMILLKVHWLQAIMVGTGFTLILYFVFAILFEVPI